MVSFWSARANETTVVFSNRAKVTDTPLVKMNEKPLERSKKMFLSGKQGVPHAELFDEFESVALELGRRCLNGREGAHGEPPFEGPRFRPGYNARSSEASDGREEPGYDGCPPRLEEDASPRSDGACDR